MLQAENRSISSAPTLNVQLLRAFRSRRVKTAEK